MAVPVTGGALRVRAGVLVPIALHAEVNAMNLLA
jgi:hypothetical protein